MFKKISIILVSCFIITLFLIHHNNKNKQITIGIIEPISHQAMDDIVQGFKETMASQFHEKIVIDVENAQSDINLQRSIIQKMKDEQFNIIIPIGIQATQMAISLVHNQPIIGLAANMTELERKKLKNSQLTIVHDEISIKKIIEFVHQVYPKLKTLTLVHSPSEKVYPEIAEGKKIALQNGITLLTKMASSLPELMAIGQSISQATDGLLILKDHLIVNGISTLVQLANSRKIPLITSDEGSIQAGGTFALGVTEKQIGMEGALQAIKILNGEKTSDIPITEMNNLNVFINKNAMNTQNLSFSDILNVSKKLNYPIQFYPSI